MEWVRVRGFLDGGEGAIESGSDLGGEFGDFRVIHQFEHGDGIHRLHVNGAGVVWIFALRFLICADIAGRTLFDRPLQAVPDIVSLSLIGCVFLQIAYAISTNRLTRAEVLLDQIRKRQPALAILTLNLVRWSLIAGKVGSANKQGDLGNLPGMLQAVAGAVVKTSAG